MELITTNRLMMDNSLEGTEEDRRLHKHMKVEREGVKLDRKEIEQIVRDMGYKAVPDFVRLSSKQYNVGRGYLGVPPLSTAVATFAHDYHNNSPYPPYSVTCDGVVCDDVDDPTYFEASKTGTAHFKDDPAHKRAVELLRMKESGRGNHSKPSHTEWVARAYAEERGIKPDSHEAILWARQEVEAVMSAIDKAIVEKGGHPPLNKKVQI